MKSFTTKLMAISVFLNFNMINVALADVDAKTNSAVEAKLSAYKVTYDGDSKKEVLTTANKVAPGDLLEYRVTYQNNGSSLLKRLTATLPLPPGMTYVAGSAKPTNAMASIGDNRYETMPLKVMVKKPNGKIEEKLLPLTQYRSLRWNLNELAQKNKLEVRARVQVNNNFNNEAKPN